MHDASSFDINYMSDAKRREWHQIMCEEGDGWSHGFDKYDVVDDGEEHIVVRDNVVKKIVKESWQKMGEAIGQSTSLTGMDLANCDLPQEAIEALFGVERTYNCPLKNISLYGNQLKQSGIAAMLPFLKSISTLKQLSLDNAELGVEGTRLLSEALNHVRVDCLSLGGNNIGD